MRARPRPRRSQEFADRVATLPLIAEPGTKWSYSIGLDVMGRGDREGVAACRSTGSSRRGIFDAAAR